MATVIQYGGRSSVPNDYTNDPAPHIALDAKELNKLGKPELVEMAKDLGVSVKGTGSKGAVLKKDLVAALLASEQG